MTGTTGPDTRLPRSRIWSLTIRARLTLSFGLIVLLMSAVGLVSLWPVIAIDEQSSRLSQLDTRMLAVLRVNKDVLEFKSRMEDALDKHLASRFVREGGSLFLVLIRDLDAALDSVRTSDDGSANRAAAIQTLTYIRASLPAHLNAMLQMAQAGDWEAVQLRLTHKIALTNRSISELVQEMDREVALVRKDALARIQIVRQRALTMAIAFGLSSLILAGVMGVLVTRSITRPLALLDAGTRSLAQGNFGLEIPIVGSDELASLTRVFNDTASRLSSLYQKLALSEAHLRDLNEDLESRVVKRTAELEAAKAEAEAGSRSKSEFLANMSHEIRTPMNGIVGMTDLALALASDSEQREYLQLAQGSADSLLTLLNDILDLSRIEAGKLTIEPVTFDPRATLHDVVRLLEVSARAKGLKLRYDCESRIPARIVADPQRIRQILINLVGNSLKFTHTGSVDICLTIDEGAGRLQFAVKDTGIGIPLEKQESIFHAFTQADSSITRKYGGSGLGLAISSKLVALMGGTICVESQPGQGTVFEFSAPYQIPTDEHDQPFPGYTAPTSVKRCESCLPNTV